MLVSAAALFVSAPRSAWAHTVAVEPPDRTDQVLTEAFSRLCGELSMYGLDVRPAGTNGSTAIAGVALGRSEGQPSARIWIAAAPATDKVVQITITVADANAPALLAIRAADVLRASLRDFRGLVLPGAPPAEAVATAVSSVAGAAAPVRSWTATAAAAALYDPATVGLGLAPSVEVRRRLRGRWSVMLNLTGPVVGHTLVSSAASAHVREALLTGVLALRVAERARASLDAFLALGPAYVAVRGDAQPPWMPDDSSAWAAASAVGARFAFRLTGRLALSASAAALVIVPRPVLDVGPASYAVGQPLLLSSLGVDLAL
ncbi:MAG TPA: hypothetical protein VLT58_17895 [Polyangia bacterium]|nr:hypothetical protein [Polyangia bacterium]